MHDLNVCTAPLRTSFAGNQTIPGDTRVLAILCRAHFTEVPRGQEPPWPRIPGAHSLIRNQLSQATEKASSATKERSPTAKMAAPIDLHSGNLSNPASTGRLASSRDIPASQKDKLKLLNFINPASSLAVPSEQSNRGLRIVSGVSGVALPYTTPTGTLCPGRNFLKDAHREAKVTPGREGDVVDSPGC